jgi:Tfp pilus assembly protein PilF
LSEASVSDAAEFERATELWQEAYRRQMAGELEAAIELYRQSIEAYPTAEAHTFLGWTLSFQGRLTEATEECLKAIQIDPDFGNPYNDIGVYLMQQGKLKEAIPWLQRAKEAPRYEPRQFPYMNLGRIYAQQGRWGEALREFQGAVRAAPADSDARKALHSLLARLNGHAGDRPPEP